MYVWLDRVGWTCGWTDGTLDREMDMSIDERLEWDWAGLGWVGIGWDWVAVDWIGLDRAVIVTVRGAVEGNSFPEPMKIQWLCVP